MTRGFVGGCFWDLMALDICGPNSTVRIEDLEEPILELPERLDVACPQFVRIRDRLEQSFKIEGAELRQLKDELFRLLDSFRALKESQLESLGMITSDDPVVRASVFDGILRRNPVHAKLMELLDNCRQAVAADQSIRCQSS